MGMEQEAPRWRRRPEERPAQILDAALAVFGECGLAGAKLEEIAERAGISKGTVYLYFESKSELFCEVLRHGFGELLQSLESVHGEASAEAQLRALAAVYWSFLRSPRYATIHRLVAAEIHNFPELAGEYGRDVRQPLEDVTRGILARGVAAGEFEGGDDAVRARALLALLVQHALWCARREFYPALSGRSDEQVLVDVIEFFVSAVRVRPVARARGGR